MTKFLDWLTTSSANPEKYSATFRGVLLMFIPLIILAGQSFGWNVTESELLVIVQELTTLAGLALTAFGILRKVYFWIKTI